jgi:hypothetical protein
MDMRLEIIDSLASINALWDGNETTTDVRMGASVINDRKVSRRNVLRVAAVVTASTTAVAVIGDAAAGSPAADPGAAPRTGKRAELGRVSRTGRPMVMVETPATMNQSRVSSPQLVPFVGFPDYVVPRVGDLVTVTDDWPGIALAAVPVCHWVTGVPKALSNGEFAIAGARVATSPLLSGTRNVPVAVCLLDTELPTAQVLATRPI